jgi:hypothetical protein
MTRAEALAELKAVLRESVLDAAWGDTRLLGYLSEGQDKFCEETGFFMDNTNHTIPTVVGTATYSIPDRIISVLDIYDATGRRLGKVDERIRRYANLDTEPQSWPSETSDTSYWQVDQATNAITLHPTPTTVQTLTLRVWRYARNELSVGTNEFEIPSRFHRACIEWAAYKSLMHHDAEQEDPVKAADHLAAFGIYVRDGKKAHRRITSMQTEIVGNPLYVVR